MNDNAESITIVIPCYNEEEAIGTTRDRVEPVLKLLPGCQVIAVNDGSTDSSLTLLHGWAETNPGVRVVDLGRNTGYGAALKAGIREVRTPLVAIIDLDGSYPIEDLPALTEAAASAHMVVGARTGAMKGYPFLRRIPKWILRKYVEWLVGQKVPDFNSGMRVMRTETIRPFLRLFPNGFSFTTTSTVAMLRDGYRVRWIPVDYAPRLGKSKIRPIRDTLSFTHLLLRTGAYFAPLRVFAPVAMGLFGVFMVSLAYDVFWLQNLTDKTVMLLLFSLNTALFSLLADMIRRALSSG